MGRTVLIVDDSTIMRQFIKSALPPDLGPTLWEARDGAEAVALYEAHRPDLVFLDLTMPVMDGVEALTRIMALDPEATVIVLTADIQTKSRARVMELGAAAFARKPPTAESLREALAQADQHRQERS